jgi:hypothetical protein
LLCTYVVSIGFLIKLAKKSGLYSKALLIVAQQQHQIAIADLVGENEVQHLYQNFGDWGDLNLRPGRSKSDL